MSEQYIKIWFAKDGKKTVGLVFSKSYLKNKSVKDVAKTWPKFYASRMGKAQSSDWNKSWVDAWMYDENKKV